MPATRGLAPKAIHAVLQGRWRQPLTYAAVGVMNTLTDFLLFVVFYRVFHAPALLATTASILAASAQSYVINGLLTFRMARRHLLSLKRATGFAALTGVCLLLAMLTIAMLQRWIGPIPAKIVSIAINLSFGFWLSKTRIFVV